MNEFDTKRIKEIFYNKLQEEKAIKHKKVKLSITITFIVIFSLMSVSVLAAGLGVLDFQGIYRTVFGEKSEYVEQYIKPFDSENTTDFDGNKSQSSDAAGKSQSASESHTAGESQFANGVSDASESQVLSESNALNESQKISDSDALGEARTPESVLAAEYSSGGTRASEPVIIESEHDGIVMKLISAVNDENNLRIFATLTDTTGDRLGESLEITDWVLSRGHGGGAEIIYYDHETRTAALMFTSLGSDHQGSATLIVDGISAGREMIEGLLEHKLDVAEILRKHTPTIVSQDEVWKDGGSARNSTDMKLFESSRLLDIDEMDIKLSSIDNSAISNIGFVDGLLHIQVRATNEPGSTFAPYLNIYFTDKNSEIVHRSNASIYFVEKQYSYGPYNKENSGESHYKYFEMIYRDVTSPEQLKGLYFTVDYMKSPEAIEGKWEFSFTIPEKATTEFPLDREIDINGEKLRIDAISLSPFGVTIHLPKNISAEYTHSDTAFIEYRNGETVELDQTSIHGYESPDYGSDSTLIFGGQIIEFENVQSIIINGERIDIAQ